MPHFNPIWTVCLLRCGWFSQSDNLTFCLNGYLSIDLNVYVHDSGSSTRASTFTAVAPDVPNEPTAPTAQYCRLPIVRSTVCFSHRSCHRTEGSSDCLASQLLYLSYCPPKYAARMGPAPPKTCCMLGGLSISRDIAWRVHVPKYRISGLLRDNSKITSMPSQVFWNFVLYGDILGKDM